jgi:hypothetical protein
MKYEVNVHFILHTSYFYFILKNFILVPSPESLNLALYLLTVPVPTSYLLSYFYFTIYATRYTYKEQLVDVPYEQARVDRASTYSTLIQAYAMLNLEGLMNRKNRNFYLHTYWGWY